MENRIIAQAKKNFRNYKIIEKHQAALELKGGDEIKSIRNHQVSISEAYILPRKNELYIINMSIAVYRYSHEKDRKNSCRIIRRRLLPGDDRFGGASCDRVARGTATDESIYSYCPGVPLAGRNVCFVAIRAAAAASDVVLRQSSQRPEVVWCFL